MDSVRPTIEKTGWELMPNKNGPTPKKQKDQKIQKKAKQQRKECQKKRGQPGPHHLRTIRKNKVVIGENMTPRKIPPKASASSSLNLAVGHTTAVGSNQ